MCANVRVGSDSDVTASGGIRNVVGMFNPDDENGHSKKVARDCMEPNTQRPQTSDRKIVPPTPYCWINLEGGPPPMRSAYLRRPCQEWTLEPDWNSSLLDDLVSAAKQRNWDGYAKGLCLFEVHDQLDLGRLLNWQIGRLLTLENPADVNTGQLI